VALLIAAALIGFGEPISIALLAIGLVVIIVMQTLKHLPGRYAH
jgi:hypothetical protein